MTMTDPILNNNIELNNKKIYFDDLSPIRECLDGCDKCLGYYIFDEIEAYSICECNCHEVLVTLDRIESIILLHQKSKYSKESKESKEYYNFLIKNSTSFDVIEEFNTKQKILKEV